MAGLRAAAARSTVAVRPARFLLLQSSAIYPSGPRMYRFAASAVCFAMLAMGAGAVSAQAASDVAQPAVTAASGPEAGPVAKRATQAVRKATPLPAAKQAKQVKKAKNAKQVKKARDAHKLKQAKKARQLAARQAKARAKQRAAVRAAKLAQRQSKLTNIVPMAAPSPLAFSPPAAASQPTDPDTVQRWPAQVVIGATVTAFSLQGQVGSASGFDNGERAMARFHGGPEVACQLMLMPRDREIPPGSTGSALMRCQAPFQVRKDQPTFTLYQGGRLVGEGNLGVLSEP
jgi:hypothetical protein